MSVAIAGFSPTTAYFRTKSLLGIASAGSSATDSSLSPSRSNVALWFGIRMSRTGTPASTQTERLMSWPVRKPGLRTGGVMREASGTRFVSGAQPVPFGDSVPSGTLDLSSSPTLPLSSSGTGGIFDVGEPGI